MENNNQSHFEHFGIKGMRWGFKTRKRKLPNSDDYNNSVAPFKRKPARTLTNQQLQQHNARMKLHTAYDKTNPTYAKQGQAFADKVLAIGAGVGGLAGVYKFSQTDTGQKWSARLILMLRNIKTKPFAKLGPVK